MLRGSGHYFIATLSKVFQVYMYTSIKFSGSFPPESRHLVSLRGTSERSTVNRGNYERYQVEKRSPCPGTKGEAARTSAARLSVEQVTNRVCRQSKQNYLGERIALESKVKISVCLGPGVET